MGGVGKIRRNPSKRESQLLFKESPPHRLGRSQLLLSPMATWHSGFWQISQLQFRSWSKKQKGGMVSLWSSYIGASQVAIAVKNPPANARAVKDTGSVPGLGRSSGEGHGNPLQCSCLENPMDRGAWWDAVHRVTKSWTHLKQLNTHASSKDFSSE